MGVRSYILFTVLLIFVSLYQTAIDHGMY